MSSIAYLMVFAGIMIFLFSFVFKLKINNIDENLEEVVRNFEKEKIMSEVKSNKLIQSIKNRDEKINTNYFKNEIKEKINTPNEKIVKTIKKSSLF